MPKLTLAEKLEARRLAAIEATDQDIANFIWKEIYDVFDSFNGFELECLDFIAILITDERDILSIEVVTKEAGDSVLMYQEEEGTLLLSEEKLARIEYVMGIVVEMASEEGLETWQDVDDEGHDYWGFSIREE